MSLMIQKEMMNRDRAVDLINRNVRELKAYHLEPLETEVKINQNESPYDWPEEIKSEMAEFCLTRNWNRYPDFIPEELKAALAEYTGLVPENIIAGNGSNEMLLTLFLSVVSDSSYLTICQPTFSVYGLLAGALGIRVETVYLNEDLSFNTERIMDSLSPGSVLILNSPNNPTGSFMSAENIQRILREHDGFVILDQAYVEFGGDNALDLVNSSPNLIITRTFSKAFGCAGVRFGYMIGAPEVITEINKVKLPYNINFFTEHLAKTVLSRTDLVKERISMLVGERERLLNELREMPLEVYDSCTNFFLIRTERKDSLFSFLIKKGILIRDVSSYPMLDECIRITVGTPEENDRLISSVREYFRNIRN